MQQSATSIRVLLAGVESEEKKSIASVLYTEPQCEIVGECDNQLSALEILQKYSPNVLFLDVDAEGFDVNNFLQLSDHNSVQTTIILTHNSQNTIISTGINIIDYLNKPVNEAQIRLSISKAKGEIVLQRMFNLRHQIEQLSEELQSCKNLIGVVHKQDVDKEHQQEFDRMIIKENGRLKFIKFNEIEWIQAWGDYVRLHCNGKIHVVHRTIGDLEAQLDSKRFLRIGRSVIVNIDYIKELEPLDHSDLLVVLLDNTQLNFSRYYRKRLPLLFDYHL